jgi:hypothetical protein
MKKNSNAFTLIKSLTMSEKRYFKIYSERHTIGEQNKYVALFDKLDKVDEENDVEIKQSLKEKLINTDFISADKNYLYQLILKSLNGFHDSKTYNLQIKETLISIEILFHKGLYQECLKLISKAEAMAEECENFQLMIDILIWKKKCSGYSFGLKKAAEVNLSIDKYILLINNLKTITDLYYESYSLQINNEKRAEKEIIKKIENILKKPELKSENNALSFSAKVFYHLTYSNYYNLIDFKEKELEHLQKLINIVNESKTYAIENPLDYVSIYNRLLGIKKHFLSPSFFSDIKTLKEFCNNILIRKEIIVQRVFVHTNTNEIEYYLINNKFHEALNKIKEIEKEILKYNIDVEPYHLIYFYYLHAITLVFTGEYHKSLKYINNVINNFKNESRPQVFLRVQVLNVIVHYELKNNQLALSLSKQVLKKNVIQKILIESEEKLLKVFTIIAGEKKLTHKDELNVFKNLSDNFNYEKSKRKFSANSLIDNYDKWVTAKVKRKLVSDIYK